jgi:hypothetical protein
LSKRDEHDVANALLAKASDENDASLVDDLRQTRDDPLKVVKVRRVGVDKGLVRRQLELSPSERLHELEAMHA